MVINAKAQSQLYSKSLLGLRVSVKNEKEAEI